MSKYLFLFVTIFLLGLTYAVTRVTEQVKTECREETGLSEEDARVLKTNEVLSRDKKCYVKCLFEKGGYIKKDGTILVDQMKSDHIADGDETRLLKVYGCVGQVNGIKTCDNITQLIDCFTL